MSSHNVPTVHSSSAAHPLACMSPTARPFIPQRHTGMPMLHPPTSIIPTQSVNPTNHAPPLQTQEIISQIKQVLRAEFNARILSLEEEVSRLSAIVSLTQQAQRSSVQLRRPQHSAPARRHINQSSLHQPSTKSTTHSNSHVPNESQENSRTRTPNTLPFRIVWGTRRNDSSQVVHKAVCALLSNSLWSLVTIKGSLRQRASRLMWWNTIMAPPEVLERIIRVWPTLEAKTSWSLRRSLSDRPAYTTQPQQTTVTSVTSHSVPTQQPNQPDATATPNVPATDSASSPTTQTEQITTSKPNNPIIPKPLWFPHWTLPSQPLLNLSNRLHSFLDVPYDPTRLWSLLFHDHTLPLLLLPLTLHYCRTPTTRATGAAYSIPH